MSQSLQIPDQVHINKVRDHLWGGPDTGASVMVGSGFSRSALKLQPGTPDLPLWRDIATAMVSNLYPTNAGSGQMKAGPKAPSAESALVIAQEYETAFGRTDLHRFLERLVPHTAFTPGETHLRLLHLPWRDVFTTNWDTLLERAAENIAEYNYSFIRDMSQIPLTGQPRIVKLHGSFPSNFPLIVTEEDYRTYPRQFAPFVNTVQQAMMETTFLLIGFSGEDPNFRRWSDWIRDNLGDAAPKIYLAGYLNLSRHRRRMLENRGVMPIDLADHPLARQWPEDQCHQYAVDWLLYTLEAGKPYEHTMWPSPPHENQKPIDRLLRPVEQITAPVPRSDLHPENNTASQHYNNEPLERIETVIEIWSHNKKLYPGWLIFPSGEERSELSRQTKEWEPLILDAFPAMSIVRRLEALREISWRKEILLEQITVEYEDASERVLQLINCETRKIEGIEADGSDWTDIRDAWRSVALSLLTDARLEMDETLFNERLESLAPFAQDNPDTEHRIQQEQCLWSLFHLDLETLNNQLDNWVVKNCDPVWLLRKSALLTEIGRHAESYPLVQEALNLIRMQFPGRRNIPGLSREGWALASKITMDNRQEMYRRWNELASVRCDAWMEMDRFQRTILGSEKRKKPVPFDLDRTQSHIISWSNEGYRRLLASFEAVRMAEVAGVPPTNVGDGDVPIPSAAASPLLRLAAEELAASKPILAVSLVLRVCNSDVDDLLAKVLSRVRVAKLTDEATSTLIQLCVSLIEYELNRMTTGTSHRKHFYSFDKTRVAMEVLSRLASRALPDQAGKIFQLGIMCYEIPAVRTQVLLGAPLRRLMDRSWDSLSTEQQKQYSLTALGLPIVGLNGFVADPEFTDPARLMNLRKALPERASDNEEAFKGIIDVLIDGLRHDGEPRNLATLRIMPLIARGLLNEEEKEAVAQALWRDCDPIEGNHKSSTTPMDGVYLVLPQLNYGQADVSFRRKWLNSKARGSDDDVADSVERLNQVAFAIDRLQAEDLPLTLSAQEIGYLLNGVREITQLLTSKRINWGFEHGRIFHSIRRVTSVASMPEEMSKDLFNDMGLLLGSTNDRRDSWFTPIHHAKLAVGYSLIPGLLNSMPERAGELKSWLRIGLTSDDDVQLDLAFSTLQYLVSDSNSTTDLVIGDLAECGKRVV